MLLITSLQDLARDGSESMSLFSIRESLQSVAVVISTLLVSLFTSIAMFSILVTGLGVFSIIDGSCVSIELFAKRCDVDMPKTLLVFPPGWSPVGPYLALPVLKSYLQEVEQYKVDIVDLNVEFYDDLLSFRHVEECCKRYRESKDSFSSNVQLQSS